MARLPLILALLLAPTVAADQQITAYSDATYPQEWRLVNDYWFNHTTFLADERTFHVRLSIPSAGDYVWMLPKTGGVEPNLPNPLAHLFSKFEVAAPGIGPWDLAATNTTPSFHTDGVHDLTFTITYRVRSLTPFEYTTILDDTAQVRAAERRIWPDANIVAHPGEAGGFVRLQQIRSDQPSSPCPEGTCAGFTNLMARDFNIVLNLVGRVFQLTFHQADHVQVDRAGDSTFVAAGSSYTANAAFDATITTSSELAGRIVELRLDDATTGPVIRLSGATLRTTLPAGEHRFYYVIHAPEDQPLTGTISVSSPRSTATVTDHITITPAQGLPDFLPWAAVSLAAVLLAWAVARRRRFTWYEYQPRRVYLVVDRRGIKPDREHRGRPPLLARIRKPGSL